MVHNNVPYDFPEKNLALKCFPPVRLQYCLIINISGKNQIIFQFFYGVSHQTKAASETTTFG